ncbi:P-selectin glycoprotein ligand 1 isoform X2 [Rhinolophus ferrumequinum]|nr:P-selectin glycoprotein ligand 1 isoform X2 [Rhinolophus ferrumequinum]XP_032954372.1 P-selectin glycoprotein ligand 1 isoform X2 [Rhinolophus ferrumequinum]XP_032954373.1 P-selectin glycoprotein ligand 1 isoform X2 [Rhinolophus ferrumequinum]
MPLQVLLLLTLLGPGSFLQLWETQENGARESPGPLLARGRRQLLMHEDFTDTYDDYHTDPPEMLETSAGAVSLSPELQAMIGSLGQRDSAGPGTRGPAKGDSAGLDAGGTASGNLSTELATQGIPVTLGPLTKELVTTISPIMVAPSTKEAPSTELSTTKALAMVPAATEALSMKSTVMEALSTGPAATEALTTEPAATEVLTMKSTVTEALSTGPAATEALTTEPAATEALTMKSTVTEALSTEPAATEALTMKSTVTEALSMGPAATEALFTEPAATEVLTMKSTVMEFLSTGPAAMEALSTDPATTKAPSTGAATTSSPTTTLLVLSHPHRGTTMPASNSTDSFINQWRKSQGLSPQSSVAPSPTAGLGNIPVKQCLLAILILALVATIFLVCTVVLAVRLSRKNHMYPVRNYSPTEMVCISALLSDRGEGPTATANGNLHTTSHGLKEGPGEDHEGDDLTLHSFLP